MQNLRIILDHLENNHHTFRGTFFIPEAWNTIGYGEYLKDPEREGQISVDPYAFITSCIRTILSKADTAADYLKPLGLENDAELNLTQSAIYGMFLRTFTAWDHYQNGEIHTGTFLKAICLLPYLKEFHIDIIYLLPVFKYGDKYKKGELGSPYAIQNIYRIDPNLHDNLLGPNDQTLLEMEFKAFVEACHILGMKVMIDFVFRTVSRDNELIATHPEWFYWIRRQAHSTFSPPVVESEKKLSALNDRSLKNLYTSKGLAEYLAQFTYSPPEIDTGKWQEILAQYEATQGNLLDLIEEAFGITTAPGFSNVLNDPQPPWTDVTYLKFYWDTNPKAKPYLPENQPPYILQDVACLNLYRGEKPNRELWDYIINVIPHYQEHYGIDGARIDMGHALPPELNKAIVARVKAKNKGFILWSEELAPENCQAAKEDGFHFISGNLWSVYNEVDKRGFQRRIMQIVTSAILPLTAALETPDTPRMAHLYRDRRKITLMVMFNFLLANTVPFITNGLELLEVQPMNLGLNNDETGRFVLDQADPMYGKLAFFDNYCLHWLNRDQAWMRRLLSDALTIRNCFKDLIGERANLIGDYRHIKNHKILFFCYYDRKTRRNLFFLANKHLRERARVHWDAIFPEVIRKEYRELHCIYTGNGLTRIKLDLNGSRLLAPGEVFIGYLE